MPQAGGSTLPVTMMNRDEISVNQRSIKSSGDFDRMRFVELITTTKTSNI